MTVSIDTVRRSRNGVTRPAASSATSRRGALVGRRPRPVSARPTAYASSIVGASTTDQAWCWRSGSGRSRDASTRPRLRRTASSRSLCSSCSRRFDDRSKASVSGASISSRRRRMASSGLVGASAAGSAADGGSGVRRRRPRRAGRARSASADGPGGFVRRAGRRSGDGAGAACSARSWAKTSSGSVPGSGGAGSAAAASSCGPLGGARGAARRDRGRARRPRRGRARARPGAWPGVARGPPACACGRRAPRRPSRAPWPRRLLGVAEHCRRGLRRRHRPRRTSRRPVREDRRARRRRPSGSLPPHDAIARTASPRVCPWRRAHRRDDGVPRARRRRSSRRSRADAGRRLRASLSCPEGTSIATAPLRCAVMAFCGIPPTCPTVPSGLIVPVTATGRPPVTSPGDSALDEREGEGEPGRGATDVLGVDAQVDREVPHRQGLRDDAEEGSAAVAPAVDGDGHGLRAPPHRQVHDGMGREAHDRLMDVVRGGDRDARRPR